MQYSSMSCKSFIVRGNAGGMGPAMVVGSTSVLLLLLVEGSATVVVVDIVRGSSCKDLVQAGRVVGVVQEMLYEEC